MKKQCQFILLPTDKASKATLRKCWNMEQNRFWLSLEDDGYANEKQHLYI